MDDRVVSRGDSEGQRSYRSSGLYIYPSRGKQSAFGVLVRIGGGLDPWDDSSCLLSRLRRVKYGRNVINCRWRISLLSYRLSILY